MLAILVLLSACTVSADEEPRTLKVLCIGSSFGVNSTQHLYQLAADCGATNIIVANLFRTAATIDVHWQQASGNLPGYEYKKNTTGTWTSKANQTMLYGIQDEAWDLIVVMQSAEQSANVGTYTDNITNLVNYVNANKTNPNAKIAWNAVWSFTGTIAANYYSDQATMYYFIVNAVKERVLTNPLIDFVIPSGTAIQNARASFLGDNFSADAMHLNSMGSYVVGMAWIKQIKGWPIDNITWSPGAGYSAETIAAVKDAVNSAVATPRRLSPSNYPPIPDPTPAPTPLPMPTPGPDGKIVIPLLTDNFENYADASGMTNAGWQMNEAGGSPSITTTAAPENHQSVSVPAGSVIYRTFPPVPVNYLPGWASPGKNARLVISFDGYLGAATGASQCYIKVGDAATGYSAVSIGRRGNSVIRYSDSIASGSTDLTVAASLPKFTKVKFVIKLTDADGEFSDVAYTKVDIYVGDMDTPLATGVDANMIDRYAKTVDRFYVGGAAPAALDNLDVSMVVDALSPLQAWRLEKFNTLNTSGNAADGADADGDGAGNLQEFLAGTDPLNPGSLLRISSFEPDGAGMKLTFSSAIGKRYRVEHSDTLAAGSWQTVVDDIAGDGSSVTVTAPPGAGGTSSFYRVAVIGP